MKHLTRTLWVGLCSLFFASTAWGAGESISVNIIGGNSGKFGKSISSTNSAGVVSIPAAFWNQLVQRSDNSAFTITQEDLGEYAEGLTEAATSNVSVTLKGACGYEACTDHTTTGDAEMLYGYIGDGQTDTGYGAQAIFSNIPYSQYDVYIYCGSDNANKQFGAIEVNGTWYPSQSTAWGDTDASRQTDANTAITLTENTNYKKISGLTSSTLAIKVAKIGDPSGVRTGLAAIQIVNTGDRLKEWRASTLGVNFTNTNNDMSSEETATTEYGFYDSTGARGGLLQERYWQNVNDRNSNNAITLTDLNNDDYTLTFASNNGIYTPGGGGKLLSSYMDNASKFTLAGLPASGYDVALIFSGDGSATGTRGTDKLSHVKVNGVAKTYNADGELITGTTSWGQRYVEDLTTISATGTSTSGRVMFLSNLTSPTLTIETVSNSNDVNVGRGTIAALQIYIKDGVTANTAVENTRTIEGSVDWATADVWTRGNHTIDMPVTGDSAKVTISGEGTNILTMNANALLNTFTVEGTQTLTLAAGSAGEKLQASNMVANANVDLTSGFSFGEKMALTSVTVKASGALTLPDADGAAIAMATVEAGGVLTLTDATATSASNAGTINLKDGAFVTRAQGKLLANERYIADAGASRLYVYPNNNGAGDLGTVSDGNEFLRVTNGATLTLAARDLGGYNTYAGDKLRIYVGGDTLSTLNLLSYTSGDPGCYMGNIVLDKLAKVIGDADGGTLVQWREGSQVTPNVIVKDNATAEWANAYWRCLNRNTHLSVGANGKLTLSGVIRGRGNTTDRPVATSGQLNKYGTGELEVTAAQTCYTGETKLHAGKITVSGAGTLGTGAVTMNSDTTLTFDVAEGEKTVPNTIKNSGLVVKKGAGTMKLTGALGAEAAINGTLQVEAGVLELSNANGWNVGSVTVDANGTLKTTGENSIPITKGSITNNGLVALGGKGSIGPMTGTGTLEVNSDNTLSGALAVAKVEVAEGATLTLTTNTGDFGETTTPSVTIANEKVLTGTGTIAGAVTFNSGAIVDARVGAPTISGTATFEGALTIWLAEDYAIPAGGDTLLTYTSQTGLTTENITIQFLDAEGNPTENTMPTAWIVTVEEDCISLALKETEKAISTPTTLSALDLGSLTEDDDLILNVTADTTLTLDEGEITVNAITVKGSGTLTLVAGNGFLKAANMVKLSTNVVATPETFDCAEISIDADKTLTLNGPTTGDPTKLGASAITGAGSVEIAKGQVKFEDVAVAVPVTTLAATTDPEKQVGTLYLVNTDAETVQTIASVITNNGALVTDGKIALTSTSNTSYGELTVKSETLALTAQAESSEGAGNQGLGGKITIERLATLENKVAWVTSATTGKLPQVHVHGTLDMGDNTAWNFAAGSSLNLYAGAKVLGGAGSWEKVFAFAGALNVYDDENVAAEDKAITFDALLSVETTEALAIAIPAGVTLNMSDVISGTDKKLSFSGAGTVVLSAANTYTGGTDIASGATVKITNPNALGAASESNKITGVKGAVLEVSGTYEGDSNVAPIVNMTGLTDSATWLGTVRYTTQGHQARFDIASMGNANSEIEFAGATGFFYNDGFDARISPSTVRLTGEGLQVTNGSTGNHNDPQQVIFPKLIGSGKFKGPGRDNWNYAFVLSDVSGFGGSIDLPIDSHGGSIAVIIGGTALPSDFAHANYKTHITIVEGATATIAAGQTWKPATGASGKVRLYGTLAGPGKVDGTLLFGATGVVDASSNPLEISSTIEGNPQFRVAETSVEGTVVLKKSEITLPTAYRVFEGTSETSSTTWALKAVDDGLALTAVPETMQSITVNGQAYPTLNEAIAAAKAQELPLTFATTQTVDSLDVSDGLTLAMNDGVTVTVTTLLVGEKRAFVTTSGAEGTGKLEVAAGGTVNITESNNEASPIEICWTWADATNATVNITPLNNSVDATKYPILTTGEGGKVAIDDNGNITYPTSLTGKGAWYEYLFEATTTNSDGETVGDDTENKKSTGRTVNKPNLAFTANTAGVYSAVGETGRQALHLAPVKLWSDESNMPFSTLEAFSATFFARVPSTPGSIFINFGKIGDATNGALALVVGAAENEVLLVYISGNGADTVKISEVLAKMTVPHAASQYHLYTFVRKASSIEIYLDKTLWTTYEGSLTIANGGFQMGAAFGGTNQLGDTRKYMQYKGQDIIYLNADGTPALDNNGNTQKIPMVDAATETDDTTPAAIDMLRLYDCDLDAAEVVRIVEEEGYAYTPPNGAYSRTITAATANWNATTSVTDPETSESTEQGVWAKDEETFVAQPAEGSQASLTANCGTTVTLNQTEASTLEALVLTTGDGMEATDKIRFETAETDAKTLTVSGLSTIGANANVDCTVVRLLGPTIVLNGKTLELKITEDLVSTWQDTFKTTGQSVTADLTGMTSGEGTVKADLSELTGWTAETETVDGKEKVVAKSNGWILEVNYNATEHKWQASLTHTPWFVSITETGTVWKTGADAESAVVVTPVTPVALNAVAVTVTAETEGTLAIAGTTPSMTVNGSGKLTLTGTAEMTALTLDDNATIVLSDTTTVTSIPTMGNDATLILGTGDTFTALPLNLNANLPDIGTIALHYDGTVTLTSSLDNSEAEGDVDAAITVMTGTTLELQDLGGYYNGAFTVETGAELKSTKASAAIPFGKWGTTINNSGTVRIAGTATTDDSGEVTGNKLPTITGTGTIYIDESAVVCGSVSGTIVVASGKQLKLADGGADFTTTPSITATSLSGAGTVDGDVTFAENAVLVPATVTVTGDITWPNAVTVKVSTAPTTVEGEMLLGTETTCPVPSSVTIVAEDNSDISTSVVVGREDGLYVAQKATAPTTEVQIVIPPVEGEEGDSSVTTQTLPDAVQTAVATAMTEAAVTTVTKVEVETYASSQAGDTVAQSAAVTEALTAAELFENVVTVTPDETNKTQGVAKIAYDFGIGRLTMKTLDSKLYILFSAKVQGAGSKDAGFAKDTVVNLVCKKGDVELSDLTAKEVTATELESAKITSHATSEKWYKVPFDGLKDPVQPADDATETTDTGTYTFTIKATKAASAE